MSSQGLGDAFGRFYSLSDKENLKAKRIQRSQEGLVWDPWPVTNFKDNAAFRAAKSLVDQRNLQPINFCVDMITILPASPHMADHQGGNQTWRLYSLRSPARLPVKFHMKEFPAIIRCCTRKFDNQRREVLNDCIPNRSTRLIVRCGAVVELLIDFLRSFSVTKMDAKVGHFCDHHAYWRKLNMSDESLMEFPERLRDWIYRKWCGTHCRFLELPAELRELIFEYSVPRIVIPLRRISDIGGPKLETAYVRLGPSMSLTLVNRQFNQEILAISFRKTTFLFWNNGPIYNFIEHCAVNTRRDLPSLLERLYSAELLLSAKDLFRVVNGVVYGSGHRLYFAESITKNTPDLETLCLKSPTLGRIVIRFT